jgi:hypothetical protein
MLASTQGMSFIQLLMLRLVTVLENNTSFINFLKKISSSQQVKYCIYEWYFHAVWTCKTFPQTWGNEKNDTCGKDGN